MYVVSLLLGQFCSISSSEGNSPKWARQLFRPVDSLLISIFEPHDGREDSRRISHAPMMEKSLPTCNTSSNT